MIMIKYILQISLSSKIKQIFYRNKYALLIAIFCFSPSLLKAQYGIKGGVTASTFYFPGNLPIPYDGYDIDLRPYLGYDAGLVQTNPQKPLLSPHIYVLRRSALSNRWGFQSELGFSQRGVDFSYSKYENIIYKVKISYLEIPLSLSYQYLQKEKLSSHFYFGGYGGYKINGIKKVAFYNKKAYKTKLNSVNNFDFGIHLGTDFRYRINEHFLLFDIRLFLGITDIFTIPEGWTKIYYDSHQTKYTGINVSMGYEL